MSTKLEKFLEILLKATIQGAVTAIIVIIALKLYGVA